MYNLTATEVLEMEIISIKEQLKVKNDFYNGVPPKFGWKYVKTDVGYRLEEDFDIPFPQDEFDRVCDLAKNDLIGEVEFNEKMSKMPPARTLNQLFDKVYLFPVKNMYPKDVKLK